MRKIGLIVIAASLASCSNPDTEKKSHDRMYEAVSWAVCSEDREDLEAALGSIANEAQFHDADGIDDYVSQMANEVICSDDPRSKIADVPS